MRHNFPADVANWKPEDFRAFEAALQAKTTVALNPAMQAEIARAQASLDLEARERAARAPGGTDLAAAIFEGEEPKKIAQEEGDVRTAPSPTSPLGTIERASR
jgi:hypothetical protein